MTFPSQSRHRLFLELFDQFLKTGGLPAVVLSAAHGGDYEEERAQIIAGYEEDFIRIFGEENLRIVKACFKSVASFAGSVSKDTTIVPSPGDSINRMINEIFLRLESWHLILKSDQKGPGPEGSHRYLPKRYLFDTGVLRHFREAAVPTLQLDQTIPASVRTPLSGILENQLAINLGRKGTPLYGWKKSSSGTEIDFIIKHEGNTYPVENKAAMSIDKRHLKGIEDYLDIYSRDTGIIVSLASFSLRRLSKNRTVVNLPVYLSERLAGKGVETLIIHITRNN
jgi:predicted AAA+ superfamily ATPase